MYLHEKELVTQIRVYLTPDGYKNKKPYEAIITAQYIGDDTVFIEGLRGRIGLQIKNRLKELFIDKGITKVLYYRNGKVHNVELS